ncbi:ribosome maturation factor RimP [Mobilicoccus sp.]|uniref:ribosome maturation factor RimP n=1 Tax=Mobilicoccus sp. TaxID=2034349 RepID=UPI00289D4827|nr:ribosome maturation factor RimP [Mobilicoccus sp.]
MGESPVARRVEDAVSGAVRALGLLVEDVTVTPAGKRRVVRITVDRDLGDVPPLRPDASERSGNDGIPAQASVPAVDLDAVAEATRAISEVLDDSDALGSAPYTLEVTSPGVGRPLTVPRHFRRNVGRLVRLTLEGDGDGAGQRVTGRLLAAGADLVWLRPEGSDADQGGRPKGAKAKAAGGSAAENEPRSYPLARIARGDVQVEFGRVDEALLADEGDGDERDGDHFDDQED